MLSRRYCAFISYRHADNAQEGRRWAEWLHRALERYVAPPDLVGTTNLRDEPIPSSLYPIFRDEDELPANADLASGIRAALDVSDYMVVLCSPRSAVSPWVRKEVREFKELGRSDRILAVMIAGEPNADDPSKVRGGILPEEECFCEELRFGVQQGDGSIDWNQRTEPLAADLRPGGRRAEGFVTADAYREHLESTSALTPERITALADAYHSQLEHGLLKVIAGLLGVTLNQLADRDAAHRAELARRELERSQAEAARLRKFNRFVFIASGVIVLLLIAGISASTWQAVRARNAESLATARLDEATRQTERATQAETLANTRLEEANKQTARATGAEALANARLEEANKQTSRATQAEKVAKERLDRMMAEQQRADQEKANALAAKEEAAKEKKNAQAATEREQQFIALFKFPTRPGMAGWKETQINGTSYVPVGNVADFYHLKRGDGEDDSNIMLLSPNLICKGAVNSKEFLVSNIKFILNYPFTERNGVQFVSRMDLVKTIDPVLRPSYIQDAQPIDTVVLDPARGGHDEGAVGTYGLEKNYTLAYAKQAGDLLAKAGFHVVLTRQDDVYLSVPSRLEVVRKQKNAILISIHFNSEEPSVTGMETYAMAPQGVPSMAGDGPRESDFIGMPGNQNDTSNIALATALHAGIVHRTKIVDRGIKRARFDILRGATIPAVMIVGGFISNKDDALLIASAAYQQRFAECIRDAVVNYKRAVGSQSPKQTPQPAANKPGPPASPEKPAAPLPKAIPQERISTAKPVGG